MAGDGELGGTTPLLSVLLSDLRAAKGSDDSETLVAINELAGMYQGQGRYAEAEPLFRESLERRHRIHGRWRASFARLGPRTTARSSAATSAASC